MKIDRSEVKTYIRLHEASHGLKPLGQSDLEDICNQMESMPEKALVTFERGCLIEELILDYRKNQQA